MLGHHDRNFILNAWRSGVNSSKRIKRVDSREGVLLLEDGSIVKVDLRDVVNQQFDKLGVLTKDVSDKEAILDNTIIVLNKVLQDLQELLLNLGVQLTVSDLCQICALCMKDQLVTDSRHALEMGYEVDFAWEVVRLEKG